MYECHNKNENGNGEKVAIKNGESTEKVFCWVSVSECGTS